MICSACICKIRSFSTSLQCKLNQLGNSLSLIHILIRTIQHFKTNALGDPRPSSWKSLPNPYSLTNYMQCYMFIINKESIFVFSKQLCAPSLLCQITSLVSVHLLAQVAGDDQIDVPKYKCLVSLDFIKSVARFVFIINLYIQHASEIVHRQTMYTSQYSMYRKCCSEQNCIERCCS